VIARRSKLPATATSDDRGRGEERRAGMSELWVDGNVLAGALRTIFAVDVTGARGRCAACGHTGPLAEARVYPAAGYVARCVSCEAVLMRLVEAPGRTFLDLHGIALLEFQH
jgi:hypothetical protein